MDRWRGKVAVVTGASAGIGAGVCKKLVHDGLQVIGLARRVERIEELSRKLKDSPGKLYAIKCDLCVPEQIRNAFAWIKANVGIVQVLVNCAGLLKLGSIIDGPIENWKILLDTHLLGLTMCARETIKQMIENNCEEGHLILVNGLGGHIPICGRAPVLLNMYSPSKFAVSALAQILREEIEQRQVNIKVTDVSSGMIDTDLFQVAHLPIDVEALPHMKTNEFAECIAYVLSTPPHIQVELFRVTTLGENYNKL